MAKRVVIIGAGPGGLASAMLLAHAGFDVTVVERQSDVGGRTSMMRLDGYSFDRGPTFFLFPQVLDSVFARCGRSLYDRVDLLRLDPQYHLIFEGGGDVRATSDVGRMECELAAISPQDAGNLQAYLQDNQSKLSAFQPILESPFESMRDVLRLPLAQLLPLMRPWASVDRDLKRFFKDPRLRLAFSFQSKYLGMSPFQCPSLFTILSFIEYAYGVYHPRGGCGAVSEAMAETARELGAEIVLGEAVEAIDFSGKRPVAVETSSGRYPCDALVINADFAHTMRTLVPDRLRRAWSDDKLAQKQYSCSTFMLYLGIEGRYDHLEHHTIYLADDYKTNLRDIESDHRLSANPSLYVQNPAVTDDTLAPAGGSGLYVLVPVTHQHENVDWQQEAAPFRARVLAQLARLGLGDLEQRIRVERMVTPDDWAATGIYRGATFNLAHTLDQMLHRRPNNRFGELDGVYLVGGGTHPGSGLPVIYESAKITAKLIADDFGVVRPWHQERGHQEGGWGSVPPPRLSLKETA